MIYLYELLLGRSQWGDRERILIRLAEGSKITYRWFRADNDNTSMACSIYLQEA